MNWSDALKAPTYKWTVPPADLAADLVYAFRLRPLAEPDADENQVDATAAAIKTGAAFFDPANDSIGGCYQRPMARHSRFQNGYEITIVMTCG